MHRIRASLLIAALVETTTTGQAVASPQRVVMPGKEVVVAIPRNGMADAVALSPRRIEVPGHLSVKLVSGRSFIQVATIAGRVAPLSGQPVPVDEAEVEEICGAIRRSNPSVPLLCEANVLFRGVRVPNDSLFGSLYNMTKLRAPTAWNTSTGSAGVTVAIVDSGIDYLHPDLHANVKVNSLEVPSNFMDDDGNGFVDDYYGYDFVNSDGQPMDDDSHGSHCAGTIGARGNNSVGVAGINWQVGLLGVKVLDSSGQGYLSDVAAGIAYAADRGASVISLSLGAGSSSQVLEDAIAYAAGRGVLLVAAAGNDGTNNDSAPTYPASSISPYILAVAATDSSDALATFSNYGTLSVDVGAPGVGILSTIPGNAYEYMSGTSMAAPLVAGLAALIKSVDSSLTPLQIKGIIMSTGEPVDSLAGITVSGKRVDAAAAIASAGGVTGPTPTLTPAASPTVLPRANTLTLSSQRVNRKIFLFGKITNSARRAVSGALITLMCNNGRVASKRSDAFGMYEFARAIPRARTVCFVKDPSGNRSRSHTIQR